MPVEHVPGTDRRATPTAPPRRRLRAAQRRELILQAAVAQFAERGYHAASMDGIAAAAGISKAVVYDHFASKQELYAVLLEGVRAEVDAAVAAAVAPVEGGGEARVRAAMEAFFRFVEDNPQACRLLFLELQSAEEAARIMRRIDARVTAGLSRQLGDDPGIFDGHPARERQLQILAELVKSAIHGLASWWYRNPDVPREDLVARTTGLIWPAIERAGAGARAGSADARSR